MTASRLDPIIVRAMVEGFVGGFVAGAGFVSVLVALWWVLPMATVSQ